MYKKFLKPLLDFIFALIMFFLFSPIFVIITIMLVFINKGKPFFVQDRPGKDNQIFYVIKFKTMNDKKDENGNLFPEYIRTTLVGKFLRFTSLDEIPQLINVIKGDMSLVGPRPMRTEYLKLYTSQQIRRHEVKPGITGWAQVNGRNSISWEDKFNFDVWYVDNFSFLLDIKILWLTIGKVLKFSDINQTNKVTMEKFKGSI